MRMKRLKVILSVILCAVFLTPQVSSLSELYLIGRFYEITPGKQLQPLKIGMDTYQILCGNWKSGDAYQMLPPELDGYLFLPELSSNICGTFDTEDKYLDFYYTKTLFSPK